MPMIKNNIHKNTTTEDIEIPAIAKPLPLSFVLLTWVKPTIDKTNPKIVVEPQLNIPTKDNINPIRAKTLVPVLFIAVLLFTGLLTLFCTTFWLIACASILTFSFCSFSLTSDASATFSVFSLFSC